MTVRRAPPHNPDLCLWGVGQAHRVLASAKCREDEVQRRRLQVEAQEDSAGSTRRLLARIVSGSAPAQSSITVKGGFHSCC